MRGSGPGSACTNPVSRLVTRLAPLLAAACWGLVPGTAVAAGLMVGADFSHVGFFQDRGITYREAGEPQAPLDLLKRQGLTCVRLRLFTSSATQAQADPYNYTNNLDYTLPLAVQVKQAGLECLLDFHYSDTWADPGKQAKPATWAGLTFPQLEERIYDYTSNTIARFKAAGAMPEYVQVGNEITSGMLWPEGRVGGSYENATQWRQLGRLLQAATRGVRDAAVPHEVKVMIHIDRGGDWAATQWYFDNLRQEAVEFDLIGLSYYPFWHGPPEALRICLINAAIRYGKPVVIAETAFPWTHSTNVFGLPATPQGQVEFVAQLATILKGIPGGRGAGVFWWGAEYVQLPGANLAGFHRRGFFDFSGNALPVVQALGQLVAPVTLEASLTQGALQLRWPFSGAGMSLQAASNLPPAGTWSTVTNAVEIRGTSFSATDSWEADQRRFYRLRKN